MEFLPARDPLAAQHEEQRVIRDRISDQMSSPAVRYSFGEAKCLQISLFIEQLRQTTTPFFVDGIEISDLLAEMVERIDSCQR